MPARSRLRAGLGSRISGLDRTIKNHRVSSHEHRVAILVGIGIDLLALDRARDLLKRHGGSFLKRILAPCEIKKKPVCSTLQLAKYFTAKEAFFKSSGLNWTDLKGFSGMWITRIKGNNFEMACSDPSLFGTGTFFKKGNIWGAKVQTWSSFILPLNLRFNRHRPASRVFKVKAKD